MHYLQYWTGVNPQKSLDSGLVSIIPLCKTAKRGTRLMDFTLALWVHGSRAATCVKQTAEQLLGVNCLFKGAQCEAGYRSTPWTWNPLNGSFIQPCRLLPELTSSHLIGCLSFQGRSLKRRRCLLRPEPLLLNMPDLYLQIKHLWQVPTLSFFIFTCAEASPTCPCRLPSPRGASDIQEIK